VYRITYKQRFGSIPRGKLLHHECEKVWCIEPTHLRPMTQAEHMKLHGIPGDHCQAKKTRCPAGHLYSKKNTYRWRSERQCRRCRLETNRRYRARGGK